MKLKDRAAFVTGGASGIGRGIALPLAREGARVAVADLNAEGARQTVSDIQAAGGIGGAQPLDITNVVAAGFITGQTLSISGGLTMV